MTERQVYTVSAEIAGRTLTLEAGQFAEQADGAVTVRYGDTVLLATVVGAREPREGIDFFPLTVDYEERMYAAGKIPGSFFKREGRPSDHRHPHRPPDRPPAAPALPEGLPPTRSRSSSPPSPPTRRTTRTRWRSSAPRRPSRSATSPSRGRSARCASAYLDGQLHRSTRPAPSSRRASSTWSSPAPRTRSSWSRPAPTRSPRTSMLDAVDSVTRSKQHRRAAAASWCELCGRASRVRPPVIDTSLEESIAAGWAGAYARLCAADQQERARGAHRRRSRPSSRRTSAQIEPEEELPARVKEIGKPSRSCSRRTVRNAILDEGIRVDGRATTRSARSRSRSACCRARTAPGSSPAARPRCSPSRPSARSARSSASTTSGSRRASGTSTTTTSRRSASARPSARVAPPPRDRPRRAGRARARAGPPSMDEFPYTIRLVSEVLSSNGSSSMGSRLRLHARADGRRRANQARRSPAWRWA